MDLKIKYERHVMLTIKSRDKLLNYLKISKFIYD